MVNDGKKIMANKSFGIATAVALRFIGLNDRRH